MKYVWSAEVDRVLCVGRSLKVIGIANWALERSAALAALEKLFAMGVAVLGCDVYLIAGEDIKQNYANCYCNRESGEGDCDFVIRSIEKVVGFVGFFVVICNCCASLC